MSCEVYVGTQNEFADGTRRLMTIRELEIGILQHGGRFYAYENQCLHQGGPVCEGQILNRVEAVVTDRQTVTGQRFSPTAPHLICPWHGYEYDLETGRCAANQRLSLRRYEIVEKGDALYVVV